MIRTLYRITAPHFCAGLISQEAKIVRAAPIIHWMRGQDTDALIAYCKLKGWKLEVVQEERL